MVYLPNIERVIYYGNQISSCRNRYGVVQFTDNLDDRLIARIKKLLKVIVIERSRIHYVTSIHVAINSHIVNDVTNILLLHSIECIIIQVFAELFIHGFLT